MPMLYLLALIIAIYFIWLYQIDDFTNDNVEGIRQFYWVVAIALAGCQAFLIVLYFINNFLVKPASLYIFAILLVVPFVCILTWVNFIKTGEIDFLETITKLIGI